MKRLKRFLTILGCSIGGALFASLAAVAWLIVYAPMPWPYIIAVAPVLLGAIIMAWIYSWD